jgi:CheY-like chemotaxis protein
MAGPLRSAAVQPLDEASARAAEPAPLAQRLPAIRILVVDDNQDAASSLGELLEELGAEVDVVNDGPSALETFATRSPSVVLLDVSMPKMDGYQVARALRTRFPERRPTIIALTGRGQPEDRRNAREAGIDHHLVKPAEFETLRELLSSVGR